MKTLIKVSLVLVIVAAMLYPALASSQLKWGQASLIGNPAPDFELATLDGSLKSLNGVRGGHSAIMFFWTTWCPHCRTQLNELMAMKEDLERKKIKIILINEGESRIAIRSFLEQNDVTYDVFFDEEGLVGRAYQVVGIPAFQFIDSRGIIRASEHYIPDNYESFFAL